MLKLTLGVASFLLAVSCASSGAPARSDSGVRTSRDRSVITLEEISESSVRDALQAVQQLRPDWLRTRGSTSIRSAEPATVVVYVDGQRYGGAETLEQFTVGSFKQLRYYSATEATNRWGTGHSGGVIYLSTR